MELYAGIVGTNVRTGWEFCPGLFNTKSLAHSKWRCKYHIVFAPKYRRQVIFGKIRADIGVILRKLCEYKGVESLEANACPDHIHMLVSIPPKISVSSFVGYLIMRLVDFFSES